MSNYWKYSSGFTLVEAVSSILLLAIISIGIIQFIGFSTEGYIETASRNQLSASSRVVIERMAMELHNALPNSVRISAVSDGMDGLNAGDQCLEFLPILAATTYIDPPFRPAASTSTIKVVEFNPAQTTGAYAVIYPRSLSVIYQDLSLANPGHVAGVNSVAVHPTLSNVNIVNLTPTHTFRRRSPESRLYLVDDPVSFCVNGERLYRYQGYEISATQPLPTGSGGSCPFSPDPCLPANTTDGRHVIATDLDNDGFTAFDHLAATLRRNAIVQFEFNFSREGETINMHHEVMLHSAP